MTSCRTLSRKILFGTVCFILVCILNIIYNIKTKKSPCVEQEHFKPNGDNDLLKPVKAMTPRLDERQFFLVVFVLSSPQNYEQRQAIRSTWANHTISDNTKYCAFFLLGRSNMRKQIEIEYKRYNDIILGEFNDTYRTLVTKVILGMRWAMRYTDFEYLVKSDDDVYLNIPRIIRWLKSDRVALHKHFYAGSIHKSARPNREGSKHFLTKDEYPRETFPPYASGAAYILSRSSVRSILAASRSVKPFFVEDAYIGCLAKYANIKPFNIAEHFNLNKKICNFHGNVNCELLSVAVFGHHIGPRCLNELHAKILAFQQLNAGTAISLCIQEWLLFLYKPAVVVLGFGLTVVIVRVIVRLKK